MTPSEEHHGSPKSADPAPAEATVAAVQEQLDVSVRETETGAVRVRKVVHEETHQVPLTARAERVSVVRVPVGHQVEAEYPARQEGDATVIPVFEYRPVVELRLFLVEEVRLTKEVVESVRTEEVTTRREEVVIERREGGSNRWVEQPPDPAE